MLSPSDKGSSLFTLYKEEEIGYDVETKEDLTLSINELNATVNEKDAAVTMSVSAQMPKEDLERLLKSINL